MAIVKNELFRKLFPLSLQKGTEEISSVPSQLEPPVSESKQRSAASFPMVEAHVLIFFFVTEIGGKRCAMQKVGTSVQKH